MQGARVRSEAAFARILERYEATEALVAQRQTAFKDSFDSVPWLSLFPRRRYAVDSRVGTVAALQAAAVSQQAPTRLRFAEAAQARWASRLDVQQLRDVADDPIRLQSLVTVGRLLDAAHPAWKDNAPAYGAFAKQNIPRHTVLGCCKIVILSRFACCPSR